MALFGTAGIRGAVGDTVTPALALAVGRAVGVEARDRGVADVVVGRDGRVTGPALDAAVEGGLLSSGVTVRRAGVVPTPTLAFASVDRVGVMVTASHNPPGDNGLKLFGDGVEFDAEAERRIQARVDAGVDPVDWSKWQSSTVVDILPDYRTAVVNYASGFGADLDGLGIAVDCGTGTAALATPQVLATLGADVTALNATVDGHFPARPSKPTPETLATLRGFVADGSYDLGIGQDGDADRIVVVDDEGEVVHEDTIVAILAERYVTNSTASTPTVLTTPNASTRIDERVAAAGGRTKRVPLGSLHEGMADARTSGERIAFAAEPWKHVHPGLGGWIDGVASAAVVSRLVAEAGDVDSLREGVTERPYRKEQVACPDSRKAAVMARLEETLPESYPRATVETAHGIRLELADGAWLLVRPSGTEPVVRLYAEGDDVDALVETAVTIVEEAVSTS